MSAAAAPALAIALLIALQRLVELAIGRRNAARLKARGGVETGAGHFPVIAAIHAAWVAALVVLALRPETQVHWPFAALYGALLGLRVWVMASLGEFWTARIITVPGAPLVRRGPYRWMRHPNYAVVAGEVAVAPLIFGAWQVALIFTILNALALRHRIRVEEAALGGRGGPPAKPSSGPP